MSDERDANDLRRSIAFERWLYATTAAQVIPTRHGLAHTHPAFPDRYDSNFLWVEEVDPTVDAAVLDAEVAAALPGFAHREVGVRDDEAGARLAPGFVDLGYAADRLVVMAWRRAADRDPEVPVVEATFDEARPLFDESTRREPYVDGERMLRMLVDWRRILQDQAGARFFVARPGGVDAGGCDLYRHDGVAMVEDVFTLEEHRGRGVARAVVLAAAGAATADGDDLVFLHAAADGWPRELYAKLGFDPIGHGWSFLRSPVPIDR